MKEQEIRKELEEMNFYCKKAKKHRVGKLSNCSIEEIIDDLKLINLEKIDSIQHYNEIKINKDWLCFNDCKKSSFEKCDDICGLLELTFYVKDHKNLKRMFTLKELAIINFD